MDVSACRLIASAADPRQFPRDGAPEIVFMGRSNVGKSSLINRLLGRSGLAHVSKTPGRTRLINFYRVNERIYFVDLPGYGWARVPEAVRRQWKDLVEAYLAAPSRAALALQLVDGRHPPTDLDIELAEWLCSRDMSHRVVLTKIDKLSGTERARAAREAARALRLRPEEPLLAVSARTGEGLPLLWRAIDAASAARRRATQPASTTVERTSGTGTPIRNDSSGTRDAAPFQGGRTNL